MNNKYTFPTEETRNIDEGICPQCGTYFSPDSQKNSAWGHDYEIECPNCGKPLHVFESVEYQINLVDEE